MKNNASEDSFFSKEVGEALVSPGKIREYFLSWVFDNIPTSDERYNNKISEIDYMSLLTNTEVNDLEKAIRAKYFTGDTPAAGVMYKIDKEKFGTIDTSPAAYLAENNEDISKSVEGIRSESVYEEIRAREEAKRERIDKEYENRKNCREEIESVLSTIPARPASSGPRGSYYDYLAKIGEYYFTHGDFASALISGEHNFYAFSEGSARGELKKNYNNVFKALSSVIDMNYEAKREIKSPDNIIKITKREDSGSKVEEITPGGKI